MGNPLWDALFAPHEGSGRVFLHLPDGEALSYGAFVEQAERLAAALVAAGVAPGDRLAVQVGKSPEALALYAACARQGVIFLPLNPAFTAAEVEYFVTDSGAAMLVCEAERLEELRAVAEQAGAQLTTLSALAETSAEVPPVATRNADDLAAILYTSGTTGRSKGAMLSQANLLSNAEVLADYWRFTAEDVLLHALPIFHTHGLFVATNIALLTGGAMIFLPKFDVDAVLAALPRATAMMGVPTFYTRLLGDPRFTREAAAHMRLFISGSAPLRAEDHAAFEAKTGHAILERYGMTETNMNTSNPYDGARRAGTVGLPLPGVDLRITGEDGAELPQGEIGQIEVRGPNVCHGYWNMPEKTKAEFRDDGFFLTGDLGLIDAEGYVQIVGRGKDLIISGGENIYPKEIEAVLDALPGVGESAVIGVPHPDLGEAAVAVIATGVALDPQALLAAARESLAAFKVPRRVVLVADLPRNAMGKVQKAALRAAHARLFEV